MFLQINSIFLGLPPYTIEKIIRIASHQRSMAPVYNRNASSIPIPWCLFDVFLSFRGEDTRNNFLSHLYAALTRKGIHCYKDDVALERGRSISPELLAAIEVSRFSIIVFSRHYASSTWCLDELAKIIQCSREMGRTALPIFYGVGPSQVRKQTGEFAVHFAKHEEKFRTEIHKVHRWRAALTEASNLSGWVSDGRSESELIEEVACFILNNLDHASMGDVKDLVGIDSRIDDLNSLLCTEVNDVRFVGIWGMGGIGKTTLAQAVYHEISHQFEVRCFLDNVKGHDMCALQDKLLSQSQGGGVAGPHSARSVAIKKCYCLKRALIVLDDVDTLKQLEELAGKKDWFGPGSRIIITTRDKHVMVAHSVDKIYEAKVLDHRDAINLFCCKAFGEQCCPDEFVALTDELLNHAKGLPLALEVLGSSLRGLSIIECESLLHKLNAKGLDGGIQNCFKVSYDGLDDAQKSLFLDIACFFNGDDKDEVLKSIEVNGTPPVFDLRVLNDRSLITIDKKVWTHELLRKMGREIVKQESTESQSYSRIWSYEDFCHALTSNSGMEKVQTIFLDLSEHKEVSFSLKEFSRMKNLRLLKIINHPRGAGDLPKMGPLYRKGNFFKELSILRWGGFPFRSLPSKCHFQNLVVLSMPRSAVRKLWRGTLHLEKMKELDLSYSFDLMETPDLSGSPNLECIVLENCRKLRELHPSILFLRRLKHLNLTSCVNLKSLPGEMEWASLEGLVLDGCSRLAKFPEMSREMPRLMWLIMRGTAIRELPHSIGYLTGLLSLYLGGCRNLASLPESLWTLRLLEQLDLSRCPKLTRISYNIGQLSSLVDLDLSRNNFIDLPSSISELQSLDYLNVRGCRRLEELPPLPSRACHVDCSGCIRLNEDPFLGTIRGGGEIPRWLEQQGFIEWRF